MTAIQARHGKTSFYDIYDRPDPRDYFRTLQPLEYQTPHHAQRVFRRLLAAHTPVTGRDGPVTVLDVCCSYGINAALLGHDVTLGDLYERYTAPHRVGLSTTRLAEDDRDFYAARRLPSAARVIGLDAARNAVAYARAAGLLDAGFGEDLERREPSPALVRELEPVRLITVTGGVGYVSHRTFGHLLAHIAGPVWVAAFVLRTVPYGPIADTLARFGLVTQTATSRTFPQRRFSDAREQRHAIEAVEAAGLSSEGRETTGFYYTQLHLSRPAEHAAAFPVEDLLEGGPPGQGLAS
jgi:SAM-dependent methyltransferase